MPTYRMYTPSKYKGLDPEVGAIYGDALMTGVDYGRYPSPRIYIRIKHILLNPLKRIIRMKNKILIIATLAGSLALSSCEDFLTHDNTTSANQETFFDTDEALEAATAPLYNYVEQF